MSWHYICNNKKFISKLEVLREHKKSKQAMQFCVPEAYENHDFTIPPKETLETLCKQKALDLRANNDKIVIWYSGGCDSHYVLDIFLKNNIKVDEIHMVKSGFSNADYEIEKYAIPFVKKLNIKTVVHEPTLDYYEKRYVENKKQLGTANEYWHHFRLNNDFENLQHHDTEGVAHIFGKEKPTLCFVDGKWYVYMLDVDVTPQPYQINFFSDDPIVHSKQCHMLIQEIQLMKNQSDYNKVTWYHEDQNFWNRSIGRYQNSTFPLKEMMDDTFNNKDAEAIKQAPSHIVDAWQNKNKTLIEELGADVFNNGDPAIGTIGIFSKFYCLSEKSVKTVDELFPDGFKIQ
tara:strand:+ start:159 stop:1193 length:1035 start_codon:yes stop_codon:yes gene_type:complete